MDDAAHMAMTGTGSRLLWLASEINLNPPNSASVFTNDDGVRLRGGI
jgi:hypothetical protein